MAKDPQTAKPNPGTNRPGSPREPHKPGETPAPKPNPRGK
jgi:hypothetical protein